MQIHGLDVYRAHVPQDEAAIKHRDAINKANAGAVQKAQETLKQDQAAKQASEQAQVKAPAQVNVNNTQPSAGPKEVMPSQEQGRAQGYNLAFMSVQDVKSVAQSLATSDEKDLSEYLFSSMSLLTSRYQEFMPTENGRPSQTQPFNFLGFLQDTQNDMTDYQSSTVDGFLERLKAFHTGIDEMV